MIVLASFDSDGDALEFYVHHIEQGPGIEESSLTHVIETIDTRIDASSDHFEKFDRQASEVKSIAELLDLTCDVATGTIGADRVPRGDGCVMARRSRVCPIVGNTAMARTVISVRRGDCETKSTFISLAKCHRAQPTSLCGGRPNRPTL